MDRPAAFTVSTGPAIVSDRVRAAQGMQSGYHDDPAFEARFRRLGDRVGEVLKTRNDIVLMQGQAVLGWGPRWRPRSGRYGRPRLHRLGVIRRN